MVGSTRTTSPTKPSAADRGPAVIRLASSPESPTASGPVDVDGRDDLPVDLAHQHHAGDLERLGVGDPQAVAELGLLAQPPHQVADLRPAAVDHHRAADRPSAAAPRPRRTTARPQSARRPPDRQGVPAVLDHHDLARRTAGCRAAPRPGARRWPWDRPGRPDRRPRSRRGPVLVDVAVAQVGGQHRRRAVPQAEVAGDLDVPAAPCGRPPPPASWSAATPSRQTVTPP